MRTTLSIDDGLLKRAKKAAADRGTSLARLVEDALREALDRPRRHEAVKLTVSKEGGGFQPGIDPRRNASFWEALEDEDRAKLT